MKLLLFLALMSFLKQSGTPITIQSSGFELHAMMPQGWTFTAEQGFVPPPALASSCRVRGTFYTDRKWDDFLVSALRSNDVFRTDARVAMKIGDHPAVSNRYTREAVTVHDTYINLSELQPDSGAVFTVESSGGSDCEMQFVALIHSARITRSPERRRLRG